MKILTRNFGKTESDALTGLEKALKMEPDAIIKAIAEARLCEHGLYSGHLIMEGLVRTRADNKIHAALNNCDLDHVALSLIEHDPLSVAAGMLIAARASGIKDIEVYLPEGEERLADGLIAALNKVCEYEKLAFNINFGIVDMRIAEKTPIIHHFGTLAEITALFTLGDGFMPSRIARFAGGKVDSGITEIPMDRNLRQLVREFAGGVDEEIKAVIIGNRFVPAADDVVIDTSFSLGSGLITIIKNDSCMADILRNRLDAVYRASCGKCTFCREGSRQLFLIFKDITGGKAAARDLDMVKEIGEAMTPGSLCSLGQTAAACALTALKNWKDEIDSHIRQKCCPAGVCSAFKNIFIAPGLCDGCGECLDVCDADAIEGKDGYIHMIDEFSCTKCGKCIGVCPVNAIFNSSGRLPPLPDKLTKVGRFKRL